MDSSRRLVSGPVGPSVPSRPREVCRRQGARTAGSGGPNCFVARRTLPLFVQRCRGPLGALPKIRAALGRDPTRSGRDDSRTVALFTRGHSLAARLHSPARVPRWPTGLAHRPFLRGRGDPQVPVAPRIEPVMSPLPVRNGERIKVRGGTSTSFSLANRTQAVNSGQITSTNENKA